MAERLPNHFLESADAGVNVDFIDLVSGKGMVQFFMGRTASGYRLSTTAFYSKSIFTLSDPHSEQTYTKFQDIDYDADFKRGVTIDGVAIFSIPMAVTSSQALNVSNYAYVRVRKWDGTTETEIASISGQVFLSNLGATEKEIMVDGIEITIPRTSFKAGESLRITTELYAFQNGGGTGFGVAFCHDPKGRLVNAHEDMEKWNDGVVMDFSSTTSATTIATALIPFKVDI